MLLFAHQADNVPISPTFAKDSIGSSSSRRSSICDKPILPPFSILPPPLQFDDDDGDDDDDDGCRRDVMDAKQRRVRFDEVSNTCHAYDRVADGERDTVWYRPADIAYFRWERNRWAEAIVEADADAAWSNALWRVYAAIAEYQSADHVAQVLNAANIELDAHTLGLTTKLLPALQHDYRLRRQRVLRILWEFQQNHHHHHHHHVHNDYTNNFATTDDERDEALRDMYREVSRAPRLFAQYTAQMAAAGIAED